MSASTLVTDGTAAPAPRRNDRSVEQIIARARAGQRATEAPRCRKLAMGLTAATAVLLFLSFTPVDFSPAAWVALVPLLLLVRTFGPLRGLATGVYIVSALYQLVTLQWMRLGDPTMYVAWLALAFYLAAYWPLFVGLSRVAVHRWSIPLVVAAPVIWTGLEYLRAHLLTGFAWYLVGHTQYRWLELIQISDITGAYGVTFVVVLANAAIASLIPTSWLARCGLTGPARSGDGETSAIAYQPAAGWTTAVACIVCVAGVLTYGVIRRHQAEFQPGPRVALIQGNFVASLRRPPEEYATVLTTHRKLTGMAVREQPDLIVWPETMFPWPLFSTPADLTLADLKRIAPQVPTDLWRDPEVAKALATESQMAGAAMMIGLEAIEPSEKTGIRHHNSAAFIRPDVGLAGRYDKSHLVPFGEYLPFAKTLPWLQAFTPYPPGWGLTAGEGAAVFEYGGWRMAPVICFEDTVPHLVRGVVAAGSDHERGAEVDVLVNLTNDGWFHGSSELDQHLITAAFRAVECRVPVVRAVNTGISAVIDGDGAIREPEVFLDGATGKPTSWRDPETGRWKKQLDAAVIQTVPLDARRSLYVRWGDWFAVSCLVLTVLLACSRFLPRPQARARVESSH